MNILDIAKILIKVFTARKNSDTSVKQWYSSGSIKASLAAILGTIGAFYGLDIPIDRLENIAGGVFIIGANAWAIWRRIRAETKINQG